MRASRHNNTLCLLALMLSGLKGWDLYSKSHIYLRHYQYAINIVLPGFKANIESRKNVNEYAEELMKITDVDKISNHDIKKVSGGQHQRATRADLVTFYLTGILRMKLYLKI